MFNVFCASFAQLFLSFKGELFYSLFSWLTTAVLRPFSFAQVLKLTVTYL